MFGIGGFELFIILVFGFLIFGPDKLPEIAKTVGKGIARFREAQQEMNETLDGQKIFDPNNPDEMFKDPVEVLDKIAQKQEEKKAAKASGDAAAKTASKSDAPAKAEPEPEEEYDEKPKPESFTERKARYERERAARKAAEEAETASDDEGGDA